MPDIILVLPSVGQRLLDSLLHTVIWDYLELLFLQVIAEWISQLFDFLEQFVFILRLGLDDAVVLDVDIGESLITQGLLALLQGAGGIVLMNIYVLYPEAYLLTFQGGLLLGDVLADVDEVCFGILRSLTDGQFIEVCDIPFDVASPVVALVTATGCFRTYGYCLFAPAEDVVTRTLEYLSVAIDIEIEDDPVLSRVGVFADIPIPNRADRNITMAVV